jgi:thiamine-phosphate pyrophosphorylase
MRLCISSIRPRKACPRGPEVDTKLLAWGRAAASSDKRHPPASPRRHSPAQPLRHPPACPADENPHRSSIRVPRIPPLWLFTDSRRLPDPRPAITKLPRGLAGVVFRHDNVPNRAALARDLARICRARRLLLVVAGDVRLAVALRAGVHIRSGRWPSQIRSRGFVTSSAHGFPDLRRAAHSGASLAFLSPAFATASHPQAHTLGPVRWSGLAHRARIKVAALGGIDGKSVRRLPRGLCCAVGAIGALA